MKVTDINTTDKAKKKIQTIAKNNCLDYQLVYYIISFHWDFDNENMWKGIEVDIDDDYHSRYKYISDKLCIRNERSSKEEVINKIYGQLKDIKTEELINNFIYGSTTKNCSLISEYASYFYLSNGNIENLNTLNWESKDIGLQEVVNNLYLKFVGGGSIHRYHLDYLFTDLTIKLPYQNQYVKTENWVNQFIKNIENNKEHLKLSDLRNTLKEFCKGDKYFLQTILEALSYSNTLKVQNHPVENIFIPDHRDKLSSHYSSNEWTYPLRFWNEK